MHQINFFNNVFFSTLFLFRLFSAASSDSIRFHSNLLSRNDNDLRISLDNTCTDSLVTALDDEALLINDYMNDMSKSKVSRYKIFNKNKLKSSCTF